MLGVTSPLLSNITGVSHRFFQRVGGTSPSPWLGLNCSYDTGDAHARVTENLARVRFQLGVGKDALFHAKQVHGSAVIDIKDDSDDENVAIMQADALVTRAQNRAVAVRTADCAPILLAARDGSVVAAVHAGWRGAVGGVIEAAVTAMGIAPADIVAAVGPCIGLDAFEVGPEVTAAASERVDTNGLVRAGKGDRMHLDLAGLCVRVLNGAGVRDVDVVGGCTVSQPQLYFSHRRDDGKTGRQIAAIARATPPDLDAESFR